jgi:inactivated superfamily I helicase
MLTKAEEKVAKLKERLRVAEQLVKRKEALEQQRVQGRRKQVAMIAFNVILKERREILEWVESTLSREQDKRAFTEWRKDEGSVNGRIAERAANSVAEAFMPLNSAA